MILLRQRVYSETGTPDLKVVGVAPKNQAPYMPNYNPNAGAKDRTTAMLNNAYDSGRNSVGIKQGAINTWKGMNDTQKGLAIGGAAVATLGTGMMIARNRAKRKEAERELELERARNRR